MGNLTSKTTKSMPSAAIKRTSKPPSKEEIFGREIMKNIQLKEAPFKELINGNVKIKSNSNFTTRTELNQQTDGTLSWQELPEIFKSVETSKKFKIEPFKIEKLKKYFSLPDK